ncbi:MAG: GspH/FimT family pseudopilin [Gallionellaceae bacterium]|jgi:type IV fimbrial biogenesis protein FimT
MLKAYTKSSHAQQGFTLIELMIGIVILAILMAVAVPSFQSWMLNTQIRNAAESVQNGLQRARSEAVTRNTNVAFTLTSPLIIDPVTLVQWRNSSWQISRVSDGTVIEARASNEGSSKVSQTAFPLNANTITFNNLGGIVPNAASLTRIDFAAVGGLQNMRVTIGVGGNVRMCDPSQSPPNPRAC